MNQATQPVRGRGTVLTAVAVAVAVVASLALAPFASAAANPVAAGSTTTITLNSGFFKKLKKAGVKVLGVSPGTVKSKTVTLPIEEGLPRPRGTGNPDSLGRDQVQGRQEDRRAEGAGARHHRQLADRETRQQEPEDRVRQRRHRHP